MPKSKLKKLVRRVSPKKTPRDVHYVGVIFSNRLLERVDRIAADDFFCTRSQAVRLLVDAGLKSFATGKAR